MPARPSIAPGGWRIALSEQVAVRGRDGADATPRARKARALLALLACKPERSARRAEIITLLWSDRGRTQALASLRQCLFELRAETPGLVTADTEQVALGDCEVDGAPIGERPAGWLGDLDQIDPAFDHWLADRRAPRMPPEVTAASAPVTSGRGLTPRRTMWVLGSAAGVLLLAIGGLAMRAHLFAPVKRPVVVALQPWSVVPGDLDMRAQAERAVTTLRADLPTTRLSVRVIEARDGVTASMRKLNADWVVRGEILGRSQPTTLVAHVETREGVLLWSTRVETGRDDLARGADRIALRTAKVLLCAAGGPPVAPRGDDVTALLMDVCAKIDPTDSNNYIEATVAAARRLAAAAPGDAYAHALVAMALAVQAGGLPAALQPAVRVEASREANRALGLNPKTGEAYLALGKLARDRDALVEAEAMYARGLAAEPDNPALPNFTASVLSSVGRNEEALVFARRALALDPASTVKVATVTEFLDRVGRRGEALALLDLAESQRAPTPLLIWQRVAILLRGGDPAGARVVLQGRSKLAGFAETAEQARSIRETYAIQYPDGPQASEMLRELSSPAYDGPRSASRKVAVLAALGRTDAALGIAMREPVDTEIFFSSGMHGLLTSPRFPEVARRQGLWRYWETTGHWPDVCREPGLPWRCGPTVKKASIPR